MLQGMMTISKYALHSVKLPMPQLAIELTMVSYSKCISTSRIQKFTVLELYKVNRFMSLVI